MNEAYRYRLTYKKTAEAAYIGHLDLLRVFQRAIRMAGLNPRYSEGFNPHLIISFAQPLSVGMAGLGELADIELTERTSPEDIMAGMNPRLPRGLEVYAASELTGKRVSAAASVRAAVYDIALPDLGGEILKQAAEALTASDNEIIKLIYKLEISGDAVRAEIACGGQNNLKPQALAAELYACAGREPEPYAAEYIRRGLLI